MRSIAAFPLLPSLLFAAASFGVGASACSGSPGDSGFSGGSSGGGSGGGSGSGASSGGNASSSSGSSSGGGFLGDGGLVEGDGATSSSGGGDATITVTTTVYAHTDDTLYSVDPMTKAVTLIGTFVGTSDTSTDSTITDLAVNANGQVFVNSESVVYQASLPSQMGGAVSLTKVTTIGSSSKFYALAFAPAGALDPNNETLVGGDSNGHLWSIDTMTGTAKDLGNFGSDPGVSGNVLALSGDIVFYDDSMGNATGLATIRSCAVSKTTGNTTSCKADYLAGVDMTKLKAAYNGTPQATLLGGVYGGSATTLGNGTTFSDVFGLGAWNSTVFGFTRHTSSQSSPMLITIDTTTGVGTPVPNTNFSFTNGWSGAGVTTKVTITVPPPPPPPPQAQ
jgi:hypothetical protein